MLDRFDIKIDVAELPPLQLLLPSIQENCETLYRHILLARSFGAIQYQGYKSGVNSRLSTGPIDKNMTRAVEIKDLLHNAMTKQKFSARCFEKVLRVAHTITDLERSAEFVRYHILGASSYRGVPLTGPFPG